MYSKKNVGPRMEPLGKPAFTGYFRKDFQSRITKSRLLLRCDEITGKKLI